MNLAAELYRIFAGSKRGHGEFTIKYQKGAKAAGHAKTVATPVTEELWQKHIDGQLGLGVVPIMPGNSCAWGCVDIDEYDGFDIEQLSMKLPPQLVICRSKSGGAHIFIFVQGTVGAALMRKKLSLVARAVGHANAEIFPKQDVVGEDDIGNWLNMPYFAGNETTRYALRGGVALSPEEFISVVGESALTMSQLVSFNMNSIHEMENDPEFDDAPPCIKYLTSHGFPAGSRNSALFSMGVFARMKFPSTWEDKIFEYNQRFMGPGTYSEVSGIIRSLNKKSYIYKCKDQPLVSVCDKSECVKCTYGIKIGVDEEKLSRPCILDRVESVTLYEPDRTTKDEPYWVFTFDDGDKMDVTLDMTRSQSQFTREYSRLYYTVVLPIKDQKWAERMTSLINPKINIDIEIKKLAPDAGPEGQLWIHIKDFCNNKAKARVKDEIILGKPWIHDKRVYFRSSDLMRYLSQQRFVEFRNGNDLYAVINRRGGKHHNYTIKGTSVACWSVPEFDQQTESFDPVEVPKEDEY